MITLADIQRRVGVTPDGILGPATLDAIAAALGPEVGRALKAPASFFSGVRAITGPLSPAQVDTINALLTAGDHWSTAWMAYGLATAWHEARLVPIEEYGKGKGLPYGKPGRNGSQVPYGRGLVQLTHDTNYERADKELHLGGALVKNYALALDPDIATQILVRGMEEGWFTGRKLNSYIQSELGTLTQFKECRRIINGTDRADMIAEYARKFQDALVLGGWG